VHEVAQRVDAGCRVVYVDSDPVAVVHARALLAGGTGVAAIRGDLRRPDEIRALDVVRRMIDFSRPVVVMMVAILHFVRDSEDPAGIVGRFLDAVPPGSYLVLSHATHDIRPESASRARDIYQRASSPLVTRTKAEISKLLEGLEQVDPGLVFISEWRPTGEVHNPERSGMYAAVARKPG
jgi:hypothetical protein